MDTLGCILSLIKTTFKSDASFEAAADLKPKTVDSWKRGKSASYLKMLPKLSELFGVTTDYLLGNEQKKKPSAEAKSFSRETMELTDQIEKLTPSNRAKLSELVRLFLADQDKK